MQLSISGLRACAWVVAPLPYQLLSPWPVDASLLQLSLVLSLVSLDGLGNWSYGNLTILEWASKLLSNLLPWICNFLSLPFFCCFENLYSFPPIPIWLVLLAGSTRPTPWLMLSLWLDWVLWWPLSILLPYLWVVILDIKLCNSDQLHLDLCYYATGHQLVVCVVFCSAHWFAFTTASFAIAQVGRGGDLSLYIFFYSPWVCLNYHLFLKLFEFKLKLRQS